MKRLKLVETKDDFAKLLGYKNAQKINHLLYGIGTDNLYVTFPIPKRSGGERVIHAPKEELKILQRKLATLLWESYLDDLNSKSHMPYFKVPNLSHAFEKGKSIITNAQVHRNKKFILNIDLQDYFDSFNFGRVRGFFLKDNVFKVPEEIATVIAQIACYKGKLPQGAPSSPIITNLISRILDYRIVKIAKKYRFSYTRYADDMTFSTNRDLSSNKSRASKEFQHFIEEVENVITSSGFKINSKKTRLSDGMQRQEVTGLVVNKKVNVKREYIKNTRAMAFNLYKDGEFKIDGKQGTLDQLTGRFAFIFQINQHNNYLLYKKSLLENNFESQKNLLGRNESKKSESKYYWKYIFYNRDLRKELFYNKQHKTYNLPKEFYDINDVDKEKYMSLFDLQEKEYKKFLFYKYFFGNDKAMIVTEGKTDPKYIKAALKKHYKDYPELIEKKEGKFVFKIDFLRHSNTIEYLFNVPEGGEGFKYWYNYFSTKIPNNIFKQRFPITDLGKDLYYEIYPNYIEYFRNLTSRIPNNPTIFLLDNEPSGHPLYKFANHAGELQIDSNNLDQIRGSNFNRITKRNSLYVMATPLIPSRNEGESSDIEDLILARNNAPVLNGKIFLKTEKEQKKAKSNGNFNFYSKEIFSKYVLKNYEQFDFNEFIPLLDGIRDNIQDYKKKR